MTPTDIDLPALAGETRIAATPPTVARLVKLGYRVVVATGAGEASRFYDGAYADAGAEIVSDDEAWRSDIVLRVNAPTPDEIAKLKDGAVITGLLSPALRRRRRMRGRLVEDGAATSIPTYLLLG